MNKDFNDFCLVDQEYTINGEKFCIANDFSFRVLKESSEYFKEAKISCISNTLIIEHKGEVAKHENFQSDYVLKRFIYELSALNDFDSYKKNVEDYQEEILNILFDECKCENMTGDTMNNFKRIFTYLVVCNTKSGFSYPNRNITYCNIRNKILMSPKYYAELKKEINNKNVSIDSELMAWEQVNEYAKLSTTPGNYIYFNTKKLTKIKNFHSRNSFNQYRGFSSYNGHRIEDKFDLSLLILQTNKNLLKHSTGCETFEDFCSKFLLNESFVTNNSINFFFLVEDVYIYGDFKTKPYEYINAICNMNNAIKIRNKNMKNVYNKAIM